MVRIINVEVAIATLDGGGVVALPTDTVYGIAGEVSHPAAIETIFQLKDRPRTRALPVLVDSVGQISYLGAVWNDNAQKLADAFWPGALTIVLGVPHELATLLGSENDTVGFRIPDDDVVRRMIAVIGPLAVSSANVHGERACHSAYEVRDMFSSHAELGGVVDGGERSGDVSTVIDMTGETWSILREGAISEHAIASLLA
jgi:tRNA threonylcarbamoyl adenosine modification protein (Sua5/YciO/YrdC/YwlC family)